MQTPQWRLSHQASSLTEYRSRFSIILCRSRVRIKPTALDSTHSLRCQLQIREVLSNSSSNNNIQIRRAIRFHHQGSNSTSISSWWRCREISAVPRVQLPFSHSNRPQVQTRAAKVAKEWFRRKRIRPGTVSKPRLFINNILVGEQTRRRMPRILANIPREKAPGSHLNRRKLYELLTRFQTLQSTLNFSSSTPYSITIKLTAQQKTWIKKPHFLEIIMWQRQAIIWIIQIPQQEPSTYKLIMIRRVWQKSSPSSFKVCSQTINSNPMVVVGQNQVLEANNKFSTTTRTSKTTARASS